MSPPVPFDRVIWNAQQCADYLGQVRQEFLRVTRHRPDFPLESKNMPRRWRAIEVTQWKPAPAKPRQTCLYRHYAKDGALLYVGISLSALSRLTDHARQSSWFDHVANITIERFPTRADARKAERAAVLAEKPKFNIWLKRHG